MGTVKPPGVVRVPVAPSLHLEMVLVQVGPLAHLGEQKSLEEICFTDCHLFHTNAQRTVVKIIMGSDVLMVDAAGVAGAGMRGRSRRGRPGEAATCTGGQAPGTPTHD